MSVLMITNGTASQKQFIVFITLDNIIMCGVGFFQ
jgi:hypothetical protein